MRLDVNQLELARAATSRWRKFFAQRRVLRFSIPTRHPEAFVAMDSILTAPLVRSTILAGVIRRRALPKTIVTVPKIYDGLSSTNFY